MEDEQEILGKVRERGQKQRKRGKKDGEECRKIYRERSGGRKEERNTHGGRKERRNR